MSQEVAVPRPQVPQALAEKVLLGGDLSLLTPTERLAYYSAVCTSLNLNPLTRPFEYLTLGKGDEKKMVLYARKDCTDQLRTERGVSVQIVSREIIEGVAVVTAQAKDMTERTDESIGAVPVVTENGEWKTSSNNKNYFKSDGTYSPLSPLERANAIMKAETKAKRRVTLSICGLGMLDESEIDGVPDSKRLYHAEEDVPARSLKPSEILARVEAQEARERENGREEKKELVEAASNQAVESSSASQHAPAPSDDPSEPWKTKLRVAHTTKEVNAVYASIPETLKQDTHNTYFDRLKELGKK